MKLFVNRKSKKQVASSSLSNLTVVKKNDDKPKSDEVDSKGMDKSSNQQQNFKGNRPSLQRQRSSPVLGLSPDALDIRKRMDSMKQMTSPRMSNVREVQQNQTFKNQFRGNKQRGRGMPPRGGNMDPNRGRGGLPPRGNRSRGAPANRGGPPRGSNKPNPRLKPHASSGNLPVRGNINSKPRQGNTNAKLKRFESSFDIPRYSQSTYGNSSQKRSSDTNDISNVPVLQKFNTCDQLPNDKSRLQLFTKNYLEKNS